MKAAGHIMTRTIAARWPSPKRLRSLTSQQARPSIAERERRKTEDLGLSGKVAVSTGGNTGIELAIGDALAREAAHLALCGRNSERLAAAAAGVRDRRGVEVLTVQADVSRAEDCTRSVAEIYVFLCSPLAAYCVGSAYFVDERWLNVTV
jgi:hypothetical protein